MKRRDFLRQSSAFAGVGMLGLAGCAKRPITAGSATAQALPFYDRVPELIPIRAHEDRLFRITVCLRPFRAQGPRLEVEKVGDKIVSHNYGHGGSGWSLSWGSAAVAVENAMKASNGDKEIAVIGCGALGLTSAITAQRAGARVTIYAKERPPEVRSARATGSWTPDSRVALSNVVAPAFGDLWERMARTSWSMYQSYLGMPGNPIEYFDSYQLSDFSPEEAQQRRESQAQEAGRHEFARYASRIHDITATPQLLPAGSHPFPTKYVRRNTTLMFNVADYSRQLMNDFLIAGGKIERVEFHSPADLASLPQKTIINCPGYGGRALWNDESITPVRGQIAWLIPQENVHYGLGYKNVNIVARRDGIVVQTSLNGEESGWNETDETPNHEEAVTGVHLLQELYSRMEAMQRGNKTA
ncbi:FAD-binding oxidoreductase [Terriglobus albidus]|uniref:D-amino-acid oxidase n=1 Tax=Terriglobus albidus TaxID=1592106 RepID=A0A5B9ECT3_9BACT|nr:FAD-dependent oxidoreductase [Terriglobus albidus]QEE29973.1 FAD-binding oxidoreductase [Terriglobus albidus]